MSKFLHPQLSEEAAAEHQRHARLAVDGPQPEMLAGQLDPGDIVKIENDGYCGCTFLVQDLGISGEVWFKQYKRCGKASCDFNEGQDLWLYDDESLTKPGCKPMRVVSYRKDVYRQLMERQTRLAEVDVLTESELQELRDILEYQQQHRDAYEGEQNA